MNPNAAAYIAAGAAVALIGVLLLRAWLSRRPTAEELERQRRIGINRIGKMADAMVIDVHETTIQYSYEVRGVEYTATQEVAALGERFPSDGFSVAGPAVTKYDPRNPANSIVLCEDWSGLRNAARLQETGNA